MAIQLTRRNVLQTTAAVLASTALTSKLDGAKKAPTARPLSTGPQACGNSSSRKAKPRYSSASTMMCEHGSIGYSTTNTESCSLK